MLLIFHLNFVGFQLFNHLHPNSFLVLFSHLCVILGLINIQNLGVGTIPALYSFRIKEPDLSIHIFEKFCFHLQDFFAVNLLCVITVF